MPGDTELRILEHIRGWDVNNQNIIKIAFQCSQYNQLYDPLDYHPLPVF